MVWVWQNRSVYSEPTGSEVVRPTSLPGRGVVVAGTVLEGCVVSSLFLARFHGATLVAMIVLVVISIASTFCALEYTRKRTKLVIAAGELHYQGPLSARLVCRVGDGSRVVEVGFRSGRSVSSRLWLVVDQSGHSRLALNMQAWSPADLELARERLSLSRNSSDVVMTPAELSSAYPESLPWWLSHTGIVGTLIFVVIALAVGCVMVVVKVLSAH